MSSNRRFLIAGLGGAAGALSLRPALVGAQGKSPQAQDSAAILAKIARTDMGFGEPRIPVQSLPGTPTAVHAITRPGSYYLTEDLARETGKNGIEILVDNVDVDGCGFHIGASSVGAVGIPGASILSKASNVTVSDLSVMDADIGVDFRGASRFVLWDVAALRCGTAGFGLGSLGQAYDLEAYQCKGAGFATGGDNSYLEECGAFECAIGFDGRGRNNLLLSNSATACGQGFSLLPGNAWGPVVFVAGIGDISADPRSSHPGANFVY